MEKSRGSSPISVDSAPIFLHFHAVCRFTILHCPRPLRAPCPGAKIRLPGAKLCEAPGPRLWKKCPAGIEDSKAYIQTIYICIYI